MKTQDWAFMSFWLWTHVLAIPLIQEGLGLKNIYVIFAIHWLAQIVFHRNLNKIMAHHLRAKYGLLKSDTPRSTVSKKARLFSKLGGIFGAFLRVLSLFLSTWKGPERYALKATWLPRYAIYILALDFLFYWSHRLQHTNKFLFKHVHGMHHQMKMPNVFSTVHDTIFEKIFNTFIQMMIINAIVPMSFWELHTAYYAIHLVECLGHSGINAHLTNPCLPFFSWFEVELSVEDHDLHHRRFTGNFCKQTRVWDKVFSTELKRLET